MNSEEAGPGITQPRARLFMQQFPSHLWKEAGLLVELWQLRLVDDVGGDQLLDLPPLGARHPHLLLDGAGIVVHDLEIIFKMCSN